MKNVMSFRCTNQQISHSLSHSRSLLLCLNFYFYLTCILDGHTQIQHDILVVAIKLPLPYSCYHIHYICQRLKLITELLYCVYKSTTATTTIEYVAHSLWHSDFVYSPTKSLIRFLYIHTYYTSQYIVFLPTSTILHIIHIHFILQDLRSIVLLLLLLYTFCLLFSILSKGALIQIDIFE